jgi:glucose/arabinose dehydrogenase
MRKRTAASFVASAVASGVLAGSAMAATPPTSPTGHKVRLVATGMTIPTSFAWGHKAMFAADGTQASSTSFLGGVFQIKHGKARKLHNSVVWASGLAFHKGILYVSAVTKTKTGKLKNQILAWRHWNGKNFTRRRAIYTAPANFQGFNGLAFGPDGRIYVGSDVGLFNGNDHGPATTSPYLYDILSMTTRGRQVKVFASGMRQPWQMAFAAGSSTPFVTDLGPDSVPSDPNPPDLLLKVHSGANYGFPKCDWSAAAKGKGNGSGKTSNKCNGFTKPFKLFPAHSDIGGIGLIGNTIYMSEFGFALPPKVVSLPTSGQGTPETIINGTGAIIALGTHAGYVYFSQSYLGSGSGAPPPAQIFRVRP